MMKTPSLFSLASLLFLVFAFTTTIVVAAEIVYDSAGNPMLNGGTYVVAPTPRIGAGRIFDAAIFHDDDTCSLAVIQAEPYITPVLPVTITALVKPTYITTSMKLFISFAHIQPNVCTNNSNWVVTDDSAEGFLAVMVGDSDNPVGSLFHIMPYESTTENYTYKLVFCDGGLCRNIGVHVDSNGYNRLVVTNEEPLVVQFDKVDNKGSFASEISMVV